VSSTRIWTRRLLAALISVAFSLVGVELAIRALGLAPRVAVIERGRFRLSENPVLGYEPVPTPEYRGEDLRFYDFREASNSLGYRDVEHHLEKPAGTLRIAVLGDSIAAGLRVDSYADTFPAILQRELRAAGLPVEVLSFAVSGYTTRQEVEALRVRALAFHPDLVLLAYCLNDDGRDRSPILEALVAEQEQRRVRPTAELHLLQHSALYRVLEFGLGNRPRAPADPEDASQSQVAEAFDELRRLADDNGFLVLVAVFPRFHRLFQHYRWQEDHDRIARLVERHGFLALDLLEAYRTCSPGDASLLSEDTWHPTAYGHRCAAEAMARTILDRAWPEVSHSRPGIGPEGSAGAQAQPPGYG